MCGEAKDFTLRVCRYFGIRNYDRLSDMQAKAIASKLSDKNLGKSYKNPDEFVAIKVTGFRGEPTAGGMRYLPIRHYSRIEFWKERNCLRVIEGPDAQAEIANGMQNAAKMYPRANWPDWTEMSVDGRLNGYWPWDQAGMKEFLLQEAKKLA
jgi:hypothetical protein